MGRKSRRTKDRRQEAQWPRVDLHLAELPAIVERAKDGPLSPEDYAKLKAATDTFGPRRSPEDDHFYQETADGGFIPAGSAEPVEDCYQETADGGFIPAGSAEPVEDC
jgi:hypothetical protein